MVCPRICVSAMVFLMVFSGFCAGAQTLQRAGGLSAVTTTTYTGLTIRPITTFTFPTTTLIHPITTFTFPTTTSTTQPKCERIQNPNEKTCMDGLCPQGLHCVYKLKPSSAAAVAAYMVPSCVCESSATTTTIQQRCERITTPSQNNCATGICPQGTHCDYVKTASTPGAVAYVPREGCVCLPDATTTTTTTLQYTWCERLQNPSGPVCLRGLCPPNTVCRHRLSLTPSSSGSTVSQLTASGKCACVPCEQQTTTTTLQSRCEAITQANANTCAAGPCPDGTRCVFKPGTQSATYLAAASVGGKCLCEPVTTTTLQRRCEAVTPANANTCAAGLCPDNTRCVYKPGTQSANYLAAAPVGGKCVCEGVTTTTLPGEIRCEAITGANSGKCAEGICPSNMQCTYMPSAAAANAGYCKCVSATTTTVQPASCEEVANPSPDACARVTCPESGKKCTFYQAVTANQQVKRCVCAGESTTTTTTTVPSNQCASIGNPSQTACRQGICSAGETCTFTQYTTGNQQVKSCVCVKKQTATTTIGIAQARERTIWNLYGLLT